MEELAHDVLATGNRTVHVGRGGQQRGAALAPPLDTATAVSDTLILTGHGRLQGVEGGVSAVARPTVCLICAQGCPIKAFGSQNFG